MTATFERQLRDDDAEEGLTIRAADANAVRRELEKRFSILTTEALQRAAQNILRYEVRGYINDDWGKQWLVLRDAHHNPCLLGDRYSEAQIAEAFGVPAGAELRAPKSGLTEGGSAAAEQRAPCAPAIPRCYERSLCELSTGCHLSTAPYCSALTKPNAPEFALRPMSVSQVRNRERCASFAFQ
jgi:hypothetical protein